MKLTKDQCLEIGIDPTYSDWINGSYGIPNDVVFLLKDVIIAHKPKILVIAYNEYIFPRSKILKSFGTRKDADGLLIQLKLMQDG